MGPSESPDQFLDDLEAFGLPGDDFSLDSTPDVFLIWPGCLDVLTLFMSVETQWLYSPDGLISGLNYSGVKVELEFHDVAGDRRRTLWADLKIMEIAALNAVTQRARAVTDEPRS